MPEKGTTSQTPPPEDRTNERRNTPGQETEREAAAETDETQTPTQARPATRRDLQPHRRADKHKEEAKAQAAEEEATGTGRAGAKAGQANAARNQKNENPGLTEHLRTGNEQTARSSAGDEEAGTETTTKEPATRTPAEDRNEETEHKAHMANPTKKDEKLTN